MPGQITQRLHLRLFLEGIEVPVIAAMVQSQPNSPIVASIQMPPLAEGTRLFPRTLVHLYFRDFNSVDSPLLQASNSAVASVQSGSVNPSSYQNATQPQAGASTPGQSQGVTADINSSYKLLFVGEMVGFQWTKNVTQRSLVLQCQDLSNYWDYAYQFSNTDIFGPGIKALFAGGSTNLFTDFLDEPGGAIIRLIQTPSTQYPGLKGLLGGIVHLLEAMGGSYYYDKKYAGQNIFFSLAELRLHITQMITAYENDPTCSRLLNAGGYDSLFGRTLGNLGSQTSFRQAINALQALIFHETYGQPCPLYVPGSGGSVSGNSKQSLANDPTSGFVATTAASLVTSLTQLISDLSSGGDTPAGILLRINSAKKTCTTTIAQITAANAQQAKSYYGAAQSALGTAVTKAGRWTPGAPVTSDITSKLSEAMQQLQKAANMDVNTTSAAKAIPARLNQQIFRPDVWFSSPPRCNVIFPEHYSTLQYERMFLQEPTRLMLKTNDSFFGEDELFDSFYFAPKALGVKSQSNDLQAILANDLLDHELFTGILPVFEKMGELNIFGARSGTVQGKVPKVGLAQRSTNFLYFKHRFAARQMQITCRFNPYIACGFPGLILDKYADQDALNLYNTLVQQAGGTNREINKTLGTNFLGNFTEVTHVADQRQGRTEIRCSYPRQPEEGVEFLGQVQGAHQVQVRQNTDATRKTDVAAITPPKAGAVGPNLGEIISVVDVTSKYKTADLQNGPKLPLYQGPRGKTGALSISVPVGIGAISSAFGNDVATYTGDPNLFVQFSAFEVTESVPRYKTDTVDLPPEEYIRPGWYGDCWSPSQITAVYNQFFQTGAITEPTQASDNTGGGPAVMSGGSDTSSNQGATDSNDPRAQNATVFSLINNRSIEDAVAFLVLVYSYAKKNNLDVNEMIKTYCWRPIASLPDIFGSSDLQLSADGSQVIQGIEGFHSRAFGDLDSLTGLAPPDIQTLLGIKPGSTVAQRADTRKRKRDAVRTYLGLLGVGSSRGILG